MGTTIPITAAMSTSRTCKVAVIGAGVSGLVVARELRRQGHTVVVFEKSHRLGGTWVYDPRVESDPLGLDPCREVVHGSTYQSLRTNLPRPLMGFLDFPFLGPSRCYGDPRAFPSHEEVLSFLEDFARETGVVESIRFQCEVVRVELGGRKDEWVVESRVSGAEVPVIETFEAVVVCNGHHTVPRLAKIPGIDKWPGKQMHSHNYRIPDLFQDKIVVVIGQGASGNDISREIAVVAKEVHIASRSPNIVVGKLDGHDNIWQHSMIERAFNDGKVVFLDGSSLHPGVILHCTGYNYHFPFLKTNGIVTVDNNRVGPLYKHIFPPHLAPWLSFIGITNKVMIFLSMELQAKWVANVLSGKTMLPSAAEMTTSIEELYSSMERRGLPKHHTHSIHPTEIDYINRLAAEAGLPSLPDWMEEMYLAAIKRIYNHDDGFRDTWDEEYWSERVHSAG